MDLMLCKEFYFSSGDYNVQKSRTGWVALMESRYKLYEIISNLDQYNVIHLFFLKYSYLELWRPSWLAERNHLVNFKKSKNYSS